MTQEYTVDDTTKVVTILVRKSPLIHHSKWVERLMEEYPGYTVVHSYK